MCLYIYKVKDKGMLLMILYKKPYFAYKITKKYDKIAIVYLLNITYVNHKKALNKVFIQNLGYSYQISYHYLNFILHFF